MKSVIIRDIIKLVTYGIEKRNYTIFQKIIHEVVNEI